MEKRTYLLLAIVAGGAVGLGWLQFSARGQALLSDVSVTDAPDSAVLALAVVVFFLFWIAAMLLVAKLLYWSWRQINGYVFWIWDLVVPESPILRFGGGLIVLMFFVLFVPLLAFQGADLSGAEQQVNETLDGNQTTDNTTDVNTTASVPTTAAVVTPGYLEAEIRRGL